MLPFKMVHLNTTRASTVDDKNDVVPFLPLHPFLELCGYDQRETLYLDSVY